MSSWRSSNVDEMARFAGAREGSLLPKEVRRRRVLSVVDFAVVGCGLPSARGAFCPDAVVRVAADDDGVVPGRPGGGTPQSPVWCSLLQMMALSKGSGGTSPMESMARQPW